MTYATKYKVPFVSVKGTTYEVQIQKDGYVGAITELTGAAEPFTVDIKEDTFLYNPTRYSTATLRIVTYDYMDDLFSINPHEFRVLLLRAGVVAWRGFIKPEIFTQDFSSTPVALEIQCESAMSTIESVDFTALGTSYTFVTLWSLVVKAVAASKGGYSFIYFPWTYASSKSAFYSPSAPDNILDYLKVSEQNFFDEESLPMKMNEVLEEICKLLGWTCADFNGDLYILDVDNKRADDGISSYKGRYVRYNVDLSASYGYSVYDYDMILPEILNIQQLGYAGSGNSIDKVPGFNKATVKVSTYPVQDIFPTEQVGDIDIRSLYYQQPDKTSTDGTIKAVKRFITPNTYKMFPYTPDAANTPVDLSTANPSSANLWFGSMLIKRMAYKVAETPANYSFEPLIQVRLMNDGNGTQKLGTNKVIFEFKDDLPVAAFANGAIGINFAVQLNLYNESMDWFKDEAFANWNTLTYFYIPFSICIGNQYLQQDGSWAAGYHEEYFTFDVAKLKEGGFVNLNSNKTLSDPYTGLTGRIIKFPTTGCVSGKVMFQMKRPIASTNLYMGFYIKGLDFKHVVLDTVQDVISLKSDAIYSNVVNDGFMNEADQVELKISTWDNDENAFSKVVFGTSYLTNNLYCIMEDAAVRLEEMLIERMVGQYRTIKDKTTQILKNADAIKPNIELEDDYFPGKTFTMIGGNVNYKTESFKLVALEKA